VVRWFREEENIPLPAEAERGSTAKTIAEWGRIFKTRLHVKMGGKPLFPNVKQWP
jgi:hypothetical protein